MVKNVRAYDLFRPLTILSLVATIALFAGGFFMAYSMDEQAKEREEQLIANGISGKILEVYNSLVPQAVWDDALSSLDAGVREWASNNIGQYLHEVGGFDQAFVLDHADSVFFAAGMGVEAPVSSYQMFAPSMHRAVSSVRLQESVRRRKGLVLGSLKEPVQAHNIARIDGKVYVIVATLVQPDFGTVKQRHSKAPIIIGAKLLDKDFLHHFGQRYLLPDLRVRQVQMPDVHDLAQVDLNDDRQRYVATLEWEPGKPGTKLAVHLAVPALLLVVGFFVVVLLLYQRSWRAAQQLIASEARASHMAYHDPLTGLPNRVMFFERLGMALDQVRRNTASVAVHCLDLDRFKEVNDTHGHQMGDELIVWAARRIAEVCRRSDTFARLSGDEFAIVQLDASPVAAARLAERIVQVMSEPIDLSGGRVHVSCSVGVNLVPAGGMSGPEALRHADLALYRAKHNGRAQFCFFEPEMDAAMRMRREIEVDLRAALVNGGLRMVYQPQADRHGNIVGVEALLRWHHPVRGDVSPGLFVQIAEECGLINDIGLFTLREAFRASRQWDGLKVAINISASQLRMRDFHERVSQLLEECDVDPRSFELEITEGLLLGDDPVTHETLMKLRQTGFSIALDDFGTGYSSLSYLQRYPIDKIKIDRSFIANLGIEQESLAVVQAIVKLARALKLDVIAEGVETEEQRQYLVGVGCEEIQGYLYSRPVDASEIGKIYLGDPDNRELIAQAG